MIYLIGGTPRTGKTTLAKLISTQLNIPRISTDALETEFMQHIPEEKLLSLFPKSKMRKETENSNDIMYSKYSAQEIVGVYLKQGVVIEEHLIDFIESKLASDESLVIEGYHLTPNLIAQLSDYDAKIKYLYLGREDVEDAEASIRSGEDPTDWVIVKTNEDQTYRKIAEMLVLFSQTIRELSSGKNYHLVDGDFHKRIQEISLSFSV